MSATLALRPRPALTRPGLHTPSAMHARIQAIADQHGVRLGGTPAAAGPARAAQEAAHWLFWARHHLGFLRLTRGSSRASLAWHYRAYADQKRRARMMIRRAGEWLVRAEEMIRTTRSEAA